MKLLRSLLATSTLLASTLATTTPAADTMKAVRIHKHGGPEMLTYEDVPKPAAAADEVLIRVHAAGVNPVDWKIAAAPMGGFGPPLPAILGFDVSGVVEDAGADAKTFKKGDEVYSYLPLGKGGGYAEFVAVQEKFVAKKPAKIDHVHAAGVPLAALTAWQALFDQGGLKEGQTVLIHGGAGGVGHFAVQFAKSKGAKVIATARPEHQAFLKELGVDTPVDYTTQKFEDFAKDVDLVLDPIGGDTQARSIGCVKSGGRLISIVQPPDAEKCKARGITGKVFLVQQNAGQLDEIAALIDAGKVKPHVSEQIPLADAGKAHQLSKNGHTQGKIVLTVK